MAEAKELRRIFTRVAAAGGAAVLEHDSPGGGDVEQGLELGILSGNPSEKNIQLPSHPLFPLSFSLSPSLRKSETETETEMECRVQTAQRGVFICTDS